MKTRFTIVLVCLWMAGSVQATMMHRYDFNVDASDVVGGLASTLFGDAVVADGSLVTDGVDDWMEMDAAGIAINTYITGLTLEMWSTQGPENQNYSLTASFGGTWDNGFGQDYIGISTTRGNDVSRGMMANTPDNDAPWADEVGVDGPELNDEVEHHYVLTVSDPAADGSGELAYYVDGELQGTAPLNGTTIAGLSNVYAYLGKGIYSVDGQVRCSINEFRIHDAALTAQEVQGSCNAGPDAPPTAFLLKHRYDFAAGADDVVGGLASTLFGDAVVADGSLVTDGVDDWMEMDAAGIAINTYITGLTLEMWSTQGPENQNYSLTASFGGTWDNGFGQDYIGISTTRGNDVSRGMMANTPDNDSPWADEVGVDGPELNDEVEHHYVLTVSDPAADGSGELAYYVDSELQGAAPLNGTTIAGLSNTFAYLGKGVYSVDVEVRCSINEFRIYGAPLTALEVLANYAAGPDEIPVGVVPTSLPLDSANITASASSSNEPDTMGPENTANGSGLNADGQHSTVETDMWLSGMGDADPWLQYEFDQVYEIEKMQIWNYNHALEPMVGFGVNDVNIAYSTDGTTWMVIEHVTVEQAPASETYEGMTVELGIAAQIVRLEINSNRSPMMVDQYGLSEVRFHVATAPPEEPEEITPVDPGTDNLIHQYTFDDGTPNDSVGQANGTLMGDAAILDGALVTDGVDDWMEIDGATIAINTYAEVTLELWAMEALDNAYTMTASFGGTWDNGFGKDYLDICTGRGDQMNRGAIANTPDSDAPWADEVGVSSPELVDDLWHHYVLTVNATELAYYVDGSLIDTAPLNGTSLSGVSNDFVYLGKGVYTVDPAWAGTIDEFSIYDRALTPGEVLFLAGN